MNKLNNGTMIPTIGYGVFRMTDQKECEEAVLNALKAGYRFIDTASAYGNEEAVGKAIERSGIPREELFISTKLWITNMSYEGAKNGFETSLKRLGLDYVDLYIIHQPYGDYYGAWRALEELYQEGKIKAIGVDNFNQERLADFMFWNKIKPMVNFLECNPFFQREDELEYLNTKDIQMLAWSPLSAGHNDLFSNETLKNIADKYHKSIAQVVLRWLTQRGIIPVVKSSHIERMKENRDIFDFELDAEEMKEISLLDTGHTCFKPRNTGERVEAFLKEAVDGHAPSGKKAE